MVISEFFGFSEITFFAVKPCWLNSQIQALGNIEIMWGKIVPAQLLLELESSNAKGGEQRIARIWFKQIFIMRL